MPVSDLLLHGPRLAAPRRPRESLRRAAADLRLPRVRGASRDLVLGVRRGGVLLRPEAHAEAQGGARECVPGAVLAALVRVLCFGDVRKRLENVICLRICLMQ